MRTVRRTGYLVAILALASVLGCAAAYHDYSECRVNCRYCAPPPLPYQHYDECVCHSCAAMNATATAEPTESPMRKAPLSDEL